MRQRRLQELVFPNGSFEKDDPVSHNIACRVNIYSP
jgi:hypothetical protein